MHRPMLSYIPRDSVVHSLTGASKLLCFLLWSFAAMLTYDTRLIAAMLVVGVVMFRVSRIRLADIRVVLALISFFLALNCVALFLFSPYHGVMIYGSRHDLIHIVGGYTLTAEQLFFELNVTMKYFTVLPVALLFLLTTNPSEFAASFNRIGVHYKIAYSIALALRYIPDIQRSYFNVALAQQARGIDISRKEKLHRRMKNALRIIIPLIFSSLARIDTISNAMELRRFGARKKRTWYSARPFRKRDLAAVACTGAMLAAAMALNVVNGGRFYNPF